MRFVVGWLDRAAVLALLAMMLLTTSDVVLRKLVNKPITGVTELVELALGAAFFFAMPGVFARGANIAMDMIDQWAPALSRPLKRMSALLMALTLAVLAWNMWKPLVDILAYGDTSADLQIPKIWFMAPAWAGIVVSLAVAVAVVFSGEIDGADAETTP
ncbi:MAG: TRAP transporter small permease [Burkholderiales bacterium]|nr:TRAP transporter small permease [Burkholderiales bacterium]